MTLSTLTNYYGDAGFLAEMCDLLAASYEEAGPFALKGLDKPVPGMELNVYTLRDDAGELMAFCTIGYHHLMHLPCGYVGLMAVRHTCKTQGLGQQLWQQLLADCRQREETSGHRILLYFTTASPIIFEWFTATLAAPAPSSKGHCDATSHERLQSIAALQYPQAAWNASTPYLLRRAAPDVRYSAEEYQRVEQVALRKPNSFFNSIALDERNGDRLLVVGYAPNLEPA